MCRGPGWDRHSRELVTALGRVASRVSPRWVVTEADATMKVSCQTTRPLLALCLHSERGRKPLRVQRRTISSDRF